MRLWREIRLLTSAATRRRLDKDLDCPHTAFVLPPEKGNLPRLEKHFYQRHAVVFWTNTLEERARGWLTKDFHSTFREIMLHVAAREELYCPGLLPDAGPSASYLDGHAERK